MSNVLLDVRGLRVEFPRHNGTAVVVNDVSFSVSEGECLSIVGESGSGKSISCLALLDLVPPPGVRSSGTILWKGEDLTAAGPNRLAEVRGGEMSIVFQDPTSALNPLMPIGKQIANVVRRHWRCSKREALDRAAEVLSEVGFPNPTRRMHALPGELSGGLRQRVAIALALSCRPQLVIADEATTNLDVSIQAQTIELFRDLKHEFGFSLIFITHDIGLAPQIADRMQVMYAGHVVERGDVSAILGEPTHPYTRGLLASAVTLSSGRDRPVMPIPGVVPDLVEIGSGAPFRSRCPVTVEGRCDREVPAWRSCGSDHEVACHRFELDGREGTEWLR